jgi:integrase/recombinase XerD
VSAAAWVDVHSCATQDRSYERTGLGPSVSDYLARRRVAGLADRTLDTYERDLARLCHMTDPKTPGEVTTRDLELVIGTWPLRSRTRARAAFRAFFDHLYGDGLIPHDPARRLPPIRTERQKLIHVFTDAEQDNLKHQPAHLRDRALTTLLLNSGIRKGEACRLQVRDLDLDHALLLIRRGKGNKSRVIPINQPPETVRVLADLILTEQLNPTDTVWYTRHVNMAGLTVKRETVGPGAFQRWWERVTAEAGVLYRNAHVCRHTYATTLLRRGVPTRTVKSFLGHASIRTTIDLYDHQSVDDLAAELERVFENADA